MKPEYLAPPTLEEAVQRLCADPQAAIIAGGTDLIPELRLGKRRPPLLVDLRRLPLDGIEAVEGRLRLGAGLTHARLCAAPQVQRCLPMLAAACAEIGGPPVRSRATLGGNLCTASPAADTIPPLLAYDAEVELFGPAGARRLPLEQFLLGPRRTALEVGEILTAVSVPLPPERSAGRFIKLGKRNAMAIAVVSVAARLDLDDRGAVRAARVALGSVAPTPIRAAAEAALVGGRPSPDLFVSAGALAAQSAAPISDVRAAADYRRRMVAVLTRRALAAAWRSLQEGR